MKCNNQYGINMHQCGCSNWKPVLVQSSGNWCPACVSACVRVCVNVVCIHMCLFIKGNSVGNRLLLWQAVWNAMHSMWMTIPSIQCSEPSLHIMFCHINMIYIYSFGIDTRSFSLFISLLPTIKSPCMLKTTMMKMMTNPTKDSLSLHKSTICVLPNQINQSVIFFYLLILSLCAVFTIRGSAQENQSGVCWWWWWRRWCSNAHSKYIANLFGFIETATPKNTTKTKS